MTKAKPTSDKRKRTPKSLITAMSRMSAKAIFKALEREKAKTMKKEGNIICRIFGHKWDKSDDYKQPCKRCYMERWLMYNRYHSLGENPYSWKIL